MKCLIAVLLCASIAAVYSGGELSLIQKDELFEIPLDDKDIHQILESLVYFIDGNGNILATGGYLYDEQIITIDGDWYKSTNKIVFKAAINPSSNLAARFGGRLLGSPLVTIFPDVPESVEPDVYSIEGLELARVPVMNGIALAVGWKKDMSPIGMYVSFTVKPKNKIHVCLNTSILEPRIGHNNVNGSQYIARKGDLLIHNLVIIGILLKVKKRGKTAIYEYTYDREGSFWFCEKEFLK